MDHVNVEIYTDGAYSPSRKIGGWAIVILENGIKTKSYAFPVRDTTNNRMEITAVIKACQWLILKGFTEATIYTDSMYVIGTMTQNWKKNKNEDLWAELEQLASQLNLKYIHVKGHSGNVYNELCDALAVNATFVD